MLLEIGDKTLEIQAGIPGTVTRLIPEYGAEITAHGALIQGVWGNSRLNFGMLFPLLAAPDDTLDIKQLDVSLRGTVILSGTCSDPNVLQAAEELPVRGIILGSIDPMLLTLAAQVSYPIIVIDGIGRRPLNNLAYRLLTTNAKHEVSLNTSPYDRHAGSRPEILIPLPASQALTAPHDMEQLAPGHQVRVCRAPNTGEIGTFMKIRPGLTSLPSGLRTAAGEVNLEKGGRIVVPLANLEVIG